MYFFSNFYLAEGLKYLTLYFASPPKAECVVVTGKWLSLLIPLSFSIASLLKAKHSRNLVVFRLHQLFSRQDRAKVNFASVLLAYRKHSRLGIVEASFTLFSLLKTLYNYLH